MLTSNYFKWFLYTTSTDTDYSNLPSSVAPNIGVVDTSGNSNFNIWNGGNSLSYMPNTNYNKNFKSGLSFAVDTHDGDYAINAYEISDKVTLSQSNLVLTQGLNNDGDMENVFGLTMTSSSDVVIKHIAIYKNLIQVSNNNNHNILVAIIPCNLELPANTQKIFTINLLTQNITEV